MKGTLFQKPFEFNLEISGESWNQGNDLKGSIAVTNHGTDKLSLDQIGVALAVGNVRKVKAKDDQAFTISEQNLFSDVSIAAGEKANLDFSFTLPCNGPITDKVQSPYLVYGNLEKPEGHLKLTVEPSNAFKPLLDVLDVFFRFKLKDRKSSKTTVDFKFISPDAKEFKALDSLVIKMKEIPDTGIDLKMQFQMKSVGVSDGNVSVEKTKKEKVLKLSHKDYLFQKDSPNQDAIRKLFQGVFDEILPKQLF